MLPVNLSYESKPILCLSTSAKKKVLPLAYLCISESVCILQLQMHGSIYLPSSICSVVLCWANVRKQVSHQEKNPSAEHPILKVMTDTRLSQPKETENQLLHLLRKSISTKILYFTEQIAGKDSLLIFQKQRTFFSSVSIFLQLQNFLSTNHRRELFHELSIFS